MKLGWDDCFDWLGVFFLVFEAVVGKVLALDVVGGPPELTAATRDMFQRRLSLARDRPCKTEN